MKILFLLFIVNFVSESVFGQLKIVTGSSLEDYSDEEINLPCDASLNRNDINLMWITWIQNAEKVYEYDGSSAKRIVEIPGYDVDLKQVQQGDIALTIARNTLTPGVFRFKCEVTEGSAEGRGETTLTVRAPPDLHVNAARNVNVTKLPYDLTCNISNLRWNKVETMTLTWKENGKDLCFFDGSKRNSQSERCHCDKANPSYCLLRLNEKKSNGDYICIVTEGKTEGNATMKVKFEGIFEDPHVPLCVIISVVCLAAYAVAAGTTVFYYKRCYAEATKPSM
ncbi:uncharacterized protein LOC120524683 [Polypterus senegalus]|uniref:uncharacterized protein LOC120524683 n=1 Tax=Polypterus senegalus TaxID=55291 RepID=UPI001962E270|nr:uncharacterized protein LOC120524683 [Polypterus senegalus]